MNHLATKLTSVYEKADLTVPISYAATVLFLEKSYANFGTVTNNNACL